MLALALTACGDGGGAAETSRAPERAGELWELDHADDRATAPGALLAYVEGLHVLVLDGDDAFAGMTKLRVRAGTGDDRVLSLAGGTEVRVARVGEGLELRFPGGEVVEMRKVERSVRP